MTQEQIKKEQNDLEQIRERDTQIHQIETDILQVNEMFVNLARMINDQGELIVTIETHVDKAGEYVVRGTEELHKARNSQSAARRKQIWLILILLVIGVIVGLIIYYSVK